MLKLRCPKCGNYMNYQNQKMLNSKLKKACVYCGKSFMVTAHIIEKL